MWAIPALIMLALASGGEPQPRGDQGSLAEPVVLRLAAPENAPEAPAAAGEAARLAAATPTARRGAPRVSKVRCAPMVCQSNCPVVKTAGGDAAPDEASAPRARAATPPGACGHAAVKDEGADTSL